MLDIASKAAKEEMKRRTNQKKINKLHKKIALRVKLQSKNETSKARKRNRLRLIKAWVKNDFSPPVPPSKVRGICVECAGYHSYLDQDRGQDRVFRERLPPF